MNVIFRQQQALALQILCTSEVPTPTSAVVLFVSPSVGGLILDKTVTNPNFVGMAVFTPVINGKLTREEAPRQRRWGQRSSKRVSRVRLAVRCDFVALFKPRVLK